MASEELKNTAIGTAMMAALAGCAAFTRLSGTPFFEPIFEALLFYLPLTLLVCYLGYLLAKAR
jgi:hypothetical protein